jgi:hypothetical protein
MLFDRINRIYWIDYFFGFPGKPARDLEYAERQGKGIHRFIGDALFASKWPFDGLRANKKS